MGLLREDLKTQRELDESLLAGVLGVIKEGEGRWAGSAGERTMMRKFEGFLVGRIQVLGRCYGKIEGVVERGVGVASV